MAVYAIGDIQGCYQEFVSLLDKIGFHKDRDTLWLTGDLVNRGPDSLSVLRFVRDLDDRAHCVLGNHDLHLLAVACGIRPSRRGDTLDDILAAPDAEELLAWLRFRPLIHHDIDLDWTMVHAGLPPQWNLELATRQARLLEQELRKDDYPRLLEKLFGNQSGPWSESLSHDEQICFASNCFTRLRYCDVDGKLDLSEKGAPGSQHPVLMPWFQVPDRASQTLKIVFGHWSTLPPLQASNLLSLDQGCVWGGRLLAARLGETPEIHSVPCQRSQTTLVG